MHILPCDYSLSPSLSPPPPFAEGEANVKGSPGEQDESLLDNWIKELESGIKGMADLTGAPAEVSVVYSTAHWELVWTGCA